MTDLLLKSSGPVADQYKVLAGDQVVGLIRLSESAPPTTPWRWTRCVSGGLGWASSPARGRACWEPASAACSIAQAISSSDTSSERGGRTCR
jgi:hypothetical protein